MAQRVLRRDGQHAKAESCDVCRQRFKTALLPLSWADYGRVWLRRARVAWGAASLAGGVVGGCVGALVAVEMIVAVASDVIVSVDGMAADSVLRAVAGTVVRTIPPFASLSPSLPSLMSGCIVGGVCVCVCVSGRRQRNVHHRVHRCPRPSCIEKRGLGGGRTRTSSPSVRRISGSVQAVRACVWVLFLVLAETSTEILQRGLQVVPMLLPSAVVAAYSTVACFATTGFVLGAAATAVGLPYLLTLTLLRALRCTVRGASTARPASASAPSLSLPLPLSLIALTAGRHRSPL